MRLLKIVLLALLLLTAAVFGASFFLPTQLEVEKKIYLQHSPEEVYPYLNNPTQWPNWSALNKKNDPTVIHLYGGSFEGKGARLQWSGDKLGNGQVVFTESISPSSITYLQSLQNKSDSVQGYFTIAPERGGSQLTWKQKTIVAPTPLARLQGVLLKYKMEQEQDMGLLGLKTLLQNHSKKRAS